MSFAHRIKLIILGLLFFPATLFAQTSTTGRIDEGPLAARPTVCTPGDYYVTTDTNPVVEYKCSANNIWNAEATGGGGGGTPAGAVGDVQCNNTTFSNCAALPEYMRGDLHTAGPNPKIDITTFGARAMFNSAHPTTTATCVSGSPNITVGTITNQFIVGDYVTVAKCGSAPAPATPAAPAVTSGASATQTVFDAVIKAYTAANTDSYILVTRDSNGGLTLPSAATTITTAVPLGQQTATVSSVTSSGTTMTITLGSNGPPNGTLFHLSYIAQGGAQPTHKFDGYYNICSGGGTTSITVCNMPFWSTTTDATAAEIIWFNGNQLSWTNQASAYQQYICGKRVGDSAYHFLGASVPVSNSYTGATLWTDWGPTVTPSTPTGFPEGGDAICTAGVTTPQYLTAKINSCTASCGSSSTWTLSINAGSTGVGSVSQDSGPALAAALSFANLQFTNTAIYIPCNPAAGTPGALFFFIAPLYLSSTSNWVEQCGAVSVNETIDLNANPSVSWIGPGPTDAGASPAYIYCGAYPCLNDANLVKNITFSANGNDASLAVIQNAGSGNSTAAMDHNRFIASGYSSMGVLSLSVFPFGYITNTRLDVGPGSGPALFDTTWTPWLYLEEQTNGSGVRIDRDYGAGRGIYLNATGFGSSGAAEVDLANHYVQGALMPMFGAYAVSGGGGLFLDAHRWTDDTSPQAMISLQTNPASPVPNFTIRSKDLAGNPVNVITGWQATQIYEENSPGNQTFFPYLTSVFPDNTNFGKLAINTSSPADNFNRANGALSSPWVQSFNGVNISGNQIVGTTAAAYNVAYYLAAIPNALPNPQTGGEFCDVTIVTYGGGGFGGCSLFDSGGLQGAQANIPGFACIANSTTLTISTFSGGTVAGPTAYSGAGSGDHLYFQGIPSGSGTTLSCTIFPTGGSPVTISGSGGAVTTYGYPAVVLNGTAFTEDNFFGGTINPIVRTTTENTYTQPQHFLSATVGNAAPIVGTLPDGALYSQTLTLQNCNITGQTPVAQNASSFVCASPGLQDGNAGFPVTTTPYTIQCDSTTTLIDRAHTLRFQSGASVVTVPLSTATGCTGGFVVTAMDESAGTLTFNRTSPDTFSIYNGGNGSSVLATTFTIASGQYVTLNQGATGIWEVRISGAGVGAGGAPSMGYYISSQCPVANTSQCFFAPSNTKVDTTCTWTNASTTVTCTDSPFISSAVEVGKQVGGWGDCRPDDQASSYGNSISDSTIVTISTFIDANHVVLSATPLNSQSNSGATTPQCFVWGNTDDAGFAALDTALAAQTTFCPKVFLAAGQYLLNNPHLGAQPPGCSRTASLITVAALGTADGNIDLPAGFELEGRGTANTIIHLGTGFPGTTSCNQYTYPDGPAAANVSSCFAIPPLGAWRDFQVTGDGQYLTCGTLTTNANNLVAANVSKIRDMLFTNFCTKQANNKNVGLVTGHLTQMDWYNNSGFGDLGILVNREINIGNRIAVENNPINLSITGADGRYNLTCYGCMFSGVMTQPTVNNGIVDNLGVLKMFGGYIQLCPTSTCIQGNASLLYNSTGTGAQFFANDVVFAGVNIASNPNQIGMYCGSFSCINYFQGVQMGSLPTGRAYSAGTSGSLLTDLGGNSWGANPPAVLFGGLIADGHSLTGACTGVATASSTLGLFGTGPNVTATTCTSTTIGSGIVTTQPRTVQELLVSTTAAGVNASSGVVTVLKNGSATTITCTVGTGTACTDNTHQVSFVAGDLLSIQFTTQAADTLAGVKAFIYWP